jgi:hypothetical protein
MKLLQKLMGHYSITTTERYARLAPDHFHEDDSRRLAVDAAFVPVPAPAAQTPTVAAAGITELDVAPAAIDAYLAEPERELPAA